ncbi:OLC1v1016067C1 [Oldenlandia corymbosa var. corymbosa]|uniref:OLC1v1016067C1 n=1 Tax=Oldenlandia corymbosa var. corymbosa TaxID=529605 RepID=A0AAV1E4V9_OLDCO|nr:OLC1v1016067C1 [Oldenlandia corymbosa var. corymbosa]
MAARLSQCAGVFYIFFVLHFINNFYGSAADPLDEETKIYIVYMGSLPENNDYSPSSHHLCILQQVVNNRFPEESLVRSYKRSFKGFAAYLTKEESEQMADHGVLPAFDDAIADGVRILTISLGTPVPIDLAKDTIAIGSFHAHKEGILTVHSAGNSGAVPGAVSSKAPWLVTIATSTTSRKFVAPVVLGNGKTLNGNDVNAFRLNGTEFPLVYGQHALKNCSASDAEMCFDGCLDKDLVKGKIVLCNTTESFSAVPEVNRTGGVVAILVDGHPQVASVTFYPFAHLSPQQFKEPDITAPGVEILTAFSPDGNPSGFPTDQRSVDYAILHGTSCPFKMDKSDSYYGDSEFGYGAGHLNPRKAPYPGLVYEILQTDYLKWICGKNFSTELIVTCAGVVTVEDKELNYPTMAAKVEKEKSFSVTFPRTVMNVRTTPAIVHGSVIMISDSSSSLSECLQLSHLCQMARNPYLKTVGDFVSTIDSDDKAKVVTAKYDIPLDLNPRVPVGNVRANTPPEAKITGRYFFKVCVPSTKFKDWYNVKMNPKSGAVKIMKAMSSSNAAFRLFGDSKVFDVKNSNNEGSSTKVVKKKEKVKRLVKASDQESRKKSNHDSILEKEANLNTTLPVADGAKEVPAQQLEESHVVEEIDPNADTGVNLQPPPLEKGNDTIEVVTHLLDLPY